MQLHKQIVPARNHSGIVRFAVLGILAMLPGVAEAEPWLGYGNGPQHNANAPALRSSPAHPVVGSRRSGAAVWQWRQPLYTLRFARHHRGTIRC